MRNPEGMGQTSIYEERCRNNSEKLTEIVTLYALCKCSYAFGLSLALFA